ncbi:hypothetical protein [Nonomuraea pusilla]|uniref:NACHT domain-containing protein n=1 Tax=Nonomuraea pusilla TaxID=46177 RepID=A0A1H7FTT5_9ACTN|nr:hypothetical protein [Nonomuraea pusilla]SEK27912.1 hypothetical protein SAMN05660976_00155 [Nonomuraea pusilla]
MAGRPGRLLAMVSRRVKRWTGRRWRHGVAAYRERHVRPPVIEEGVRYGGLWSKRTAVRVAGAVLTLWLLFSLFMVLSRFTRFAELGAHFARHTTGLCGDGYSVYCTAVISLMTTVLYAALLYAIFLAVSYERVTRAYRQRAWADPRSLVQTVGSILGDVVGRDQLCDVLIANMRTRKIRRPQILVGPIGAGKTAVLVKVVEILAQRGMIPVVVRLRDTEPGVSIQTMARRRFEELVDNDIRSAGEADRVWRQLRAENRIIVLGDGLEEALASHASPERGEGPRGHEQEGLMDRDSALRQAIRRVIDEDLPLLITSRPYDPLRGMEATIVELEPLGEGPALEYLCSEDGDGDGRVTLQDVQRLYQLVQIADVVESPLYLQIIKRLNMVGRLWQTFPAELVARGDRQRLDATGLDRADLRRRLLDGWRDALVQGYDHEDYALEEACREAVVDVLGALACVGLKQNRLEVRFGDLAGHAVPYEFDSGGAKTPKPGVPPHPEVWQELRRRLGRTRYAELADNLGMAATLGQELGIVEAHEDRVRFRHSLIQSYLGALFLRVALEDEKYLHEAFYDPGREFLLALVFHAASLRGDAGEHDRFAAGMIDLLMEKSAPENARSAATVLDMFSAALEIDSGTTAPDPAALMRKFSQRWQSVRKDRVRFDQALSEAKTRFVKASCTATRIAVARRPAGAGSDAPREVYRWLYEIARGEHEYRISLSTAQAIGAGGDDAFAVLGKEFDRVFRSVASGAEPDEEDRRERAMCAWLAPMLYRSARSPDGSPGGSPRGSRDGWYGGAPAGEGVEEHRHRQAPPQEEHGDRRPHADEANHGEPAHPREEHLGEPTDPDEANLDRWIGLIEHQDDEHPLISLEIALAQGFKHAANQRDQSPGTGYDRARLIEKTEWMLKHSRYWFTHLTLIQALTLCSLPEDPEAPVEYQGRGSDPQELVRYWLGIAGSLRREPRRPGPGGLHPFVREAADLCVLALSTRRPAEYCWMDESAVAAQVGSYSASRASQYGQDRWIMSSVGWSTLHPRAQRLVADILILLNLAERGRQQSQIEARLSRADRADLPPCIVSDRRPLDLERTIGAAETAHPGSNCLDGCPFRLCPYPPQGDVLRYAEFNESFCNQQAALARRRAPWQELSHRELRRFWLGMAGRARPKSPDRGDAWPAPRLYR